MQYPNSHIIFLLGADRVGKSTFAQNIHQSITQHGVQNKKINIIHCHFDGPKPHHNSPIEQYIEKIQPELNNTTLDHCLDDKYFICDRGGAEVCFYEKYRRGLTIPETWAQSFESWALDKFTTVNTILLEANFEDILHRHENEINLTAPRNATAYWKQCQLDIRRAEHKAYYEYMHNYLTKTTLIPSSFIHTLRDNSQKIADKFVNCQILYDDIPF